MVPIWSDGRAEMPFALRGPLPQAEYEAVYARVPRLTVEVVIASEAGVLLTRARSRSLPGPLAHPRAAPSASAKPLTAAVARVARQELGLDVRARGAARVHRVPEPPGGWAGLAGRRGVPGRTGAVVRRAAVRPPRSYGLVLPAPRARCTTNKRRSCAPTTWPPECRHGPLPRPRTASVGRPSL